MSAETLGQKGSVERLAEARKLRELRKVDRESIADNRNHRYVTTRELEDYEYALKNGAVESFLRYVRKLRPNPRVLEIGAGSGLALSQIAALPEAQGTEFLGTTLAINSAILKNLPKESIKITPAETLRGIENESVEGILAVYSLAYADPQRAVKRIAEVLRPDGVVFASFSPQSNVGSENPLWQKAYGNLERPQVMSSKVYGEAFQAEFEKQGFVTEFVNAFDNDLLMAVKPGEYTREHELPVFFVNPNRDYSNHVFDTAA